LIDEASVPTPISPAKLPGSETCVLEFNPDGHHLAYVEILIRFLWQKTGQKTLFLTSAGVPESEGYGIYLGSIQERFEMQAEHNISAGKGSRMWRQFFPILTALKKLRERGIRRVYVPTGDEFALILGLARLLGLGPKGLEIRCGLLLLPLAYPTSSRLRRFKRRLFLWLQRKSGATLLCFDSHAVEILRREFGIALETVPDPMLASGDHSPAPTVPSPRPPTETLCLGTIGFFDHRKGVDLLLDAFQRARFKRPVKLLLAGRVNDPILTRKLMEAGIVEGGKIQTVNRVLSTEEYAAALGEIDVLCLTYRSHVGPSGVYAQAAARGKIIVASDYGWLGWEGKNYNKSFFFKDQSLASLIECLEETVSDFDSLDGLAGNYFPTTEEDFTKVFCSA
jgi:glycosyltransferase involved in cell wall biosynthesis